MVPRATEAMLHHHHHHHHHGPKQLDLNLCATRALVAGAASCSPADRRQLREFVQGLESEKAKIEVFRRELPLCARLLVDVIEALRAELEEDPIEDADDGGDKMSWMRNAQLWINPDDAAAAEFRQSAQAKAAAPETTNHDVAAAAAAALSSFGAPSTGESGHAPLLVPDLSSLPPLVRSYPAVTRVSATDGGTGGSGLVIEFNSTVGQFVLPSPPAVSPAERHQQQQHHSRKVRRCWSPNLHRLFVAALQKLGGPKVATPKQIRDLMKVDGLTNDEVKSHLQKYRLNNQKPAAAQPTVGNPPFLFVADQPAWIAQGPCCSNSDSQHSGLQLTGSGSVVYSATTVSADKHE